MSGGEWDCSAYGPEGRQYGALCFLTEHGRICPTLDDCEATMTAERQRVFSRISELAAHGDETGEQLAGEFPAPGDLLG